MPVFVHNSTYPVPYLITNFGFSASPHITLPISMAGYTYYRYLTYLTELLLLIMVTYYKVLTWFLHVLSLCPRWPQSEHLIGDSSGSRNSLRRQSRLLRGRPGCRKGFFVYTGSLSVIENWKLIWCFCNFPLFLWRTCLRAINTWDSYVNFWICFLWCRDVDQQPTILCIIVWQPSWMTMMLSWCSSRLLFVPTGITLAVPKDSPTSRSTKIWS